MKTRDGLPDDLPEVLAMTVALSGMLLESVEFLADFYLRDCALPFFWRVAEEDGRLRASLSGVAFVDGDGYDDAYVVHQVSYKGELWAPVLLWRQFERWAAAQGAQTIVSSAPATPFGKRDAPVQRFLAAAGLEVTGPVEVQDGSMFLSGSAPPEIWMRKELH